MNFFVHPPKVNAADYLPEQDARKTASIRLTSAPSYWDDEIVQNLLRDNPYIPSQRVVVNFKRKDDAQGAALGYIGIIGAPHLSIPVIVKNRELSPLDILIIRSKNADTDMEQGAGDLTDDKVVPLTEESFNQALDTGEIGDVIPEVKVRGCGYTEDGTQLRLPFRGRTVLASVMGATEEQKKKLAEILTADKESLVGFVKNNTGDVVNSWLDAKVPVNLVQQKLASARIERSVALIPSAIPVEKATDFLAAEIFVDTDRTKVAVAFDGVDLTTPSKKASRWFIYNDGTYSRAPEKVAVVESQKTEEELAEGVLDKVATRSLHRGSTVSFRVDDQFTAPAKIASIVSEEATKTISLTMIDNMGQKYGIFLAPGLKTAMYVPQSKCWALPILTEVLELGEYQSPPIETEKIAVYFESQLQDQLVCAGDQFTLSIRGETFGLPQCNEQKIAEVLDTWFENGSDLLVLAKQAAKDSGQNAGVVKFASNLNNKALEVVKLAEEYHAYPKVAQEAVNRVSIDLDKAVKLAASIGDPNGADAILSTGFLNEDNLAEFVNLSDQFKDTVSKLARLLLAIRMGYPADESATVVAMKALQRVAERLQSAVQEAKA